MSSKRLITQFESYLLTERRVAQNTFDAYKRDLEQFFYFLKERVVVIEQAVTQDIKEFIKFLRQEGISAKTVARKLSCLKTFYAYLAQHHDIENPTQQIITPKIGKKLPHHLSEQEIEKLFSAAQKDITESGIRNKVMLYVLYVTGARITELVTLKVTDVDFDSGFIKISGKGSKERMVPIGYSLIQLLQEYLKIVYPRIVQRESIKAVTDFLFPVYYNRKLGPLTRQSFWIYLKRVASQAGIKKELSPHVIRHSLATHLLKKGANLRSLQLLLGHEQLTTVQIYTHVETSHLRKIYDEKHPRS